jgi:hypothetical protein
VNSPAGTTVITGQEIAQSVDSDPGFAAFEGDGSAAVTIGVTGGLGFGPGKK